MRERSASTVLGLYFTRHRALRFVVTTVKGHWMPSKSSLALEPQEVNAFV